MTDLSNWKRYWKLSGSIFSIVVSIALLLTLLFLAYPQPWITFVIQKEFSLEITPNVYTLPTIHHIIPYEPASNQEITYRSISFRAPWYPIKDVKELGDGKLISFNTEDDNFIYVSSFSPMIQNVLESSARDNALYSEISTDRFKIFNRILSVTPADLNVLTPSEEANQLALLITLKSIIVADSEILHLQGKQVRGFQFGNPELNENQAVLIHLFGDNDKQIDLMVKGSQKDIDTILASITFK